MSEIKEEAKAIITQLIGPVNAEKVDSFDEGDPNAFIGKCKDLIAGLLGPTIAESKLKPLYDKYT